MANHGKTGEKLEQYRAKRRQARKVWVQDAKSNKHVWSTTEGRYGKPSYLKRKEKRAGKK